MTIEYKERYTVSGEHRTEILTVLEEQGPLKPWTLLSEIEAPHKAMKELVLIKTIQVNSAGYLYLPDKET